VLRPRLLAALVVGVLLPGSTAVAADPVVTVPRDRLERSLACSGSLSQTERAPVLLVHGTGSNPQESWRSSYAYALPRDGFAVCTVELPDRAMDDLQISAEYVVHAIREMAARSGRRVSVVGHSQGGLHPVWALRFWTELRGRVEDVVALASPFQGTTVADCERRDCQPAGWQQRRGSRFLEALNRGSLPEGPAYTSLATRFDQVVVPQPEASRLPGARNIVLQDVCPGRTVDHFNILYDNLAYQLVLDALRHDGPADPARTPPAVCQTASYAFDERFFASDVAAGATNLLAVFATYPTVPEEPALFCYADPSSTRGAGTTCPLAAGARLRLRVSPTAVTARRRARLRFTVTAAGDRVARARIRIAGRSARTNRNGRATIRVRFARPRLVRARATRPGFRAATATVRVRAPSRRQPRYTG
jgi:triacylglycerol lipase